MHPTRRSWAVAGLVAAVAALAVAVARPLLLGGAAIAGAWFLARQAAFLAALEDAADGLAIEQSPTRLGVRTTASTPVTLAARLGDPSDLELSVRAGLPTAAEAEDPLEVDLEPGETGAEATTDIAWPTAGRHRFGPATLSATDGWFHESVPVGSGPTVTAEPPGPRDVHVGEGGDQLAIAYGEHEAGRQGSGLEPAELREYVPGDTADNIDWKATARLSSPHVREYEAETERRTLLVADHRGALSTGRPGERKLDYLREVALATTAAARELGDPLGLLAVGDAGLTGRLEPASNPRHYVSIRRRLLDLEPTEPEVVPAAASDPSAPDGTAGGATALRRTIADLEGGDEFAERLRPFYTAQQGYRERFDDDPLYGAVRTARGRHTERVWTVILTDDSAPDELRETVALAREDGEVLVLLAPTVLYEPGGLADVEAAYDRYVAFEEFRRELAGMDRVRALEVGPGDRLSTVLSVGRSRRSRGEFA